jgi:K+-transporting ATPase ATPase A chain
MESGSQPKASERVEATNQVVAVGPAATQVIARDLGTSGGGFFNANSAHPFESPTPLSDFLLLLVQTVVAAGLTHTYGRMVGDTRQGWAILSVMLVVLVLGTGALYLSEATGNPHISELEVDAAITDQQPGGNMEGKEVRFGIARTALTAAATTATSTGAPNGMQDSLTPIGGLVALVMMQLGEVILGGVGSGLSGMVILVLIAVFIAGLMVGRTPEYLGKKLEPFEIKMVSIAILVMPILTLAATALALMTDVGRGAIFNPGPHGFSEVLYAYTSMANNNGSSFGGLNANSLFYNVSGGLVMLLGRFWIAVPTLALAGSFAAKRVVHVSEGALPTHTPLFAVWLTVVALVISAMAFLPALALGPIVEHLLMVR